MTTRPVLEPRVFATHNVHPMGAIYDLSTKTGRNYLLKLQTGIPPENLRYGFVHPH